MSVCHADQSGWWHRQRPGFAQAGRRSFLLSTADSDVYLWAKGVAVHAGLDAQVGAPDVSTLQIQGPTSAAIVADAFGDHILDLGYYTWVQASLDRMDVIISRTGYSAEVGFEVYLVGSKRAEELWDRILTIGKPHGLAPGSPNRIRRIEAGILDWGSDIDVDTNPYELGMSRMVALDKPYPFIGREALSAIAASGPRRRLTGLVLDGRPLEKNNEHRWEVSGGRARAGEVTAAVHSPRLGQNIALAILDVESLHNRPRGRHSRGETGRRGFSHPIHRSRQKDPPTAAQMSAFGARALVFFASASVLVIEILAGRLMAPYVGVTIESFTGIIGTVLAAIALGSMARGPGCRSRTP